MCTFGDGVHITTQPLSNSIFPIQQRLFERYSAQRPSTRILCDPTEHESKGIRNAFFSSNPNALFYDDCLGAAIFVFACSYVVRAFVPGTKNYQSLIP